MAFTTDDHERLTRVEDQLAALHEQVQALLRPEDHDRVIRLGAELAALTALNDERDRLLVQRYDLGEKNLANAIESLRTESKTAYDGLATRADIQAQVLAGLTGTSSGRNGLIVLVALGISFISLLGGLVDLLLR